MKEHHLTYLLNLKMLISLILYLFISIEGVANTNSNFYLTPNRSDSVQDEITLIVSSDGSTKEEAVKTALRSAIEQAFGTFVSANTQILNDELIKDEIITVTSGNIKNYKEISFEVSQSNRVYVTLEATVSIPNLVSYAKSKGSKAEFAGALFGMNMKMKELNKSNEKKVLNSLLRMVEEVLPYAFDRELQIEEPINITFNEFKKQMFIEETSSQEHQAGYRVFRDYNDTLYYKKNGLMSNEGYYDKLDALREIGLTSSNFDFYLVRMKLLFKPNETFENLFTQVLRTIIGLSLVNEEIIEYNRLNLPISEYRIDISEESYRLKFRCEQSFIREWNTKLAYLFREEFKHFKIIDNMGVESTVNLNLLTYDAARWYDVINRSVIPDRPVSSSFGGTNNLQILSGKYLAFKQGTGVLNKVLIWPYLVWYNNDLKYSRFILYNDKRNYKPNKITEITGADDSYILLDILFPKSNISKYSSFEIIR